MPKPTRRQAHTIRLDAYLAASDDLRFALWLHAPAITDGRVVADAFRGRLRALFVWEQYCLEQLHRARAGVSNPRGMFAA